MNWPAGSGRGNRSNKRGDWARLLAWQCAPHSLFVLDKKRTGRARSKRKNRYGGSVRAGAYLQPPARDGWPFLAGALIKRDPLGETSGPGRARIPPASLSAGAALAVNAGRRGHPPVSRPHLLPSRAQADLEGQSFRHPPRGLYQTNNRGARPMKLSGPARAGRRSASPVGTDSEQPKR